MQAPLVGKSKVPHGLPITNLCINHLNPCKLLSKVFDTGHGEGRRQEWQMSPDSSGRLYIGITGQCIACHFDRTMDHQLGSLTACFLFGTTHDLAVSEPRQESQMHPFQLRLRLVGEGRTRALPQTSRGRECRLPDSPRVHRRLPIPRSLT